MWNNGRYTDGLGHKFPKPGEPWSKEDREAYYRNYWKSVEILIKEGGGISFDHRALDSEVPAIDENGFVYKMTDGDAAHCVRTGGLSQDGIRDLYHRMCDEYDRKDLEELSLAVAEKTDDPDVLDVLSCDASPDVRLAVAWNPHTSDSTLQNMCENEDNGIPAIEGALNQRGYELKF